MFQRIAPVGMGNDASGTGRVSPGTRHPNTRREVRTVTAEALGWYGSIFLWLLFTGIGVPPCPEEAGIIYAAGVTALHPDVKWWLAWPATGAGIVAADMVLYGIGRLWGRRLFDYRWVQRIVKPERRQRIEDKFHGH